MGSMLSEWQGYSMYRHVEGTPIRLWRYVRRKNSQLLVRVFVAQSEYDSPETARLYPSAYLDISVPLYPSDVPDSHRRAGRIEGLAGTEPGTVLHNKGVATMLVNTAIQQLHEELPAMTFLYGFLPNSKDEDEENRRHAFWTTFGFDIRSFGQNDTKFMARLSDLKVNRVKSMVFGRLPSMPKLDGFKDDRKTKSVAWFGA